MMASNLEGEVFYLPYDFEGSLNLLQLSFFQNQQSLMQVWQPTLQHLLALHSRLRCYHLPVIQQMSALQQYYISTEMHAATPNAAQRARTLPLYVDLPSFIATLNLPSIRTIYVLLLNAAGQVVWRTDGANNALKTQALLDVVESVLGAGISDSEDPHSASTR